MKKEFALVRNRTRDLTVKVEVAGGWTACTGLYRLCQPTLLAISTISFMIFISLSQLAKLQPKQIIAILQNFCTDLMETLSFI